MLSLLMSEPSSEDQEEFPEGPLPPPPDSESESDLIEEIPEATLDSDIVVPTLIELPVPDLTPVPSREAVPLQAYPARSTSFVGSRSLIGETNMVPHRLYADVVRECYFLHG